MSITGILQNLGTLISGLQMDGTTHLGVKKKTYGYGVMFISPLLKSGRHPYPGKVYQNDHNPLLQGFAGQSQ